METPQATDNLKVYTNTVGPVTPSGTSVNATPTMDASPMEESNNQYGYTQQLELGDNVSAEIPPKDDAPGYSEGGDKHIEDEQDEEEDLFAESTHGFMVHYDRSVPGHNPKLFVSLFVIAVQYTLYSVILSDAIKGISGDSFTIPVKVRFGRSCEKVDNLVCPPELPELGYTTLAGCLLAFFLMYDMIASVRLLIGSNGFWAKFGALVILSEGCMAAMCGTLFALSAEEGYDAIANCIGVLFIHDVDEKAYEAFKAIKFDKICKCKWNCCRKLYAPQTVVFMVMFSVLVFSMSMASIVRQLQLEHITATYGESYTEKFFGDTGTYEYAWDSDSDYDPESYWNHYVWNYYYSDSGHDGYDYYGNVWTPHSYYDYEPHAYHGNMPTAPDDSGVHPAYSPTPQPSYGGWGHK